MFKRASKRKPSTKRRSVLQVTATRSAAPAGLPAGAFLLFGGLTLLMLGWGIWLLAGWMSELLFVGNDRFELRTIEARTDGVLPEGLLIEWSGVSTGVNLFELKLNEVQARLERHPIIRRAVVQRQLPETLRVRVNERVPLVRMGQVEGHMNWLVDEEGVVIQKSFQSKHLPFLLGVPQDVRLGDRIDDGPAGPALEYMAELRDLPNKIRSLLPVHVINLGHPDFLDVRLRDGFQLLLPRDGNMYDVLMEASRLVYENERRSEGLTQLNLLPEGPNIIGARD